MTLSKRGFGELLGTFWLVFGGCGSAVLAAAFPNLGIGFAGVALAFGLTLLTMAFTIGPISGCHINPAVSIGLVVGRRFPVSELLPYVVAQVLGAIVGSGALYVIASGKEGFSLAGGFASNGYRSPLARWLFVTGMFRGRGSADAVFPASDIWFHGRSRSQGFRSHRHRAVPYPDPSDFHSRHEHFRQSSAEYGPCDILSGVGGGSVMAFLGGPNRWRRPGGLDLFLAVCRRSAKNSSRR